MRPEQINKMKQNTETSKSRDSFKFKGTVNVILSDICRLACLIYNGTL